MRLLTLLLLCALATALDLRGAGYDLAVDLFFNTRNHTQLPAGRCMAELANAGAAIANG